MNKVEVGIQSALATAGVEFVPGREYRLAKVLNVAKWESQGWVKVADYSPDPSDPLVIMEKVDE